MLASQPALTHPIRVLLVDDSGVSRALMTRWIDESGIASVAAVATDGASAVTTLQHSEIDVVVLDVEMPGLDGLSAIRIFSPPDPASTSSWPRRSASAAPRLRWRPSASEPPMPLPSRAPAGPRAAPRLSARS